MTYKASLESNEICFLNLFFRLATLTESQLIDIDL